MRIDNDLKDSAKRASDIVNEKLAEFGWWELRNKFIAIRLSDGSSDGTIYDTKRDAVRHTKDEQRHAFVCFRSLMNGAKPYEMAVFLQFNRNAYAAGFRLSDPDDIHGGKVPVPTTNHVDDIRRAFTIEALNEALRKLPNV